MGAFYLRNLEKLAEHLLHEDNNFAREQMCCIA